MNPYSHKQLNTLNPLTSSSLEELRPVFTSVDTKYGIGHENSFKFNTINQGDFELDRSLDFCSSKLSEGSLRNFKSPLNTLNPVTNLSLNSRSRTDLKSNLSSDPNLNTVVEREFQLCMLNCPRNVNAKADFLSTLLKDKIKEVHKLQSEYSTLFSRFESVCQESEFLGKQNDLLVEKDRTLL